MVFIDCRVSAVLTFSTATGALLVEGLPFNRWDGGQTGQSGAVFPVQVQNVLFIAGSSPFGSGAKQLTAVIDDDALGSVKLLMTDPGTSTWAAMQIDDSVTTGATVTVRFSGWYIVA